MISEEFFEESFTVSSIPISVRKISYRAQTTKTTKMQTTNTNSEI